MYVIQWNEVIKRAVKHTGKWACYVNNGLNFDEYNEGIWHFVVAEMSKLYTKIDLHEILPTLSGSGLFFFDTEEECYKFYNIFTQPLTDSSAIYAATYSPDGECETEMRNETT